MKNCPFCGKEVINILTDADMGYSDPEPENNFVVVCNALYGGCGATAGYGITREEAIEKWENRV